MGKRWLVVLLVPLAIYLTWDLIDYRYLHPVSEDVKNECTGDILRSVATMRTACNVVAIPAAYLYAAMFPLMQKVTYGTELMKRPVVWDIKGSLSLAQPWVVLAVSAATLLGMAWIGMGLRGLMGRRGRESPPPPAGPGWGFALVPLALLGGQVVLVVAGRANMRGLLGYVLGESTYYAYLVMPLLIVAAYQCCRSIGFHAIGRIAGPRRRIGCAAVLLTICVCNAARVRETNTAVRERHGMPAGMEWAGADTLGMCRHVQQIADPHCENILVLVGYSYQRHGLHLVAAGGREEEGKAKFAFGAAIVQFDTSLVRAMECNERGKHIDAFNHLDATIMANENLMPPFSMEYVRACRGAHELCTAAIKEHPDNLGAYELRLLLNYRMERSSDALADIAQVKRLGGTVGAGIEEEIRERMGK